MSQVELTPRQKACQAQRSLVWEKARAARGNRQNPDGWHTLKAEIVTDGKALVILGEPPENDEQGEIHHCDSMGCGWVHVLASVNLSDEQQKQIAHLIPSEDD